MAAKDNKQTINQKIAELDAQVDWFYSEDFSLDAAADNYKKAVKLAKDIETDLKSLKNEIAVIDKDFAKD